MTRVAGFRGPLLAMAAEARQVCLLGQARRRDWTRGGGLWALCSLACLAARPVASGSKLISTTSSTCVWGSLSSPAESFHVGNSSLPVSMLGTFSPP